MQKLEKEKFSEKFKTTLITLVISAFGFVAALSWNDAIKSGIETLLPPENSIGYKFLAAIVATAIAVSVVYFISKFQK
ncbi:MAG TPA: DUF5654 family protein [archaeon]|nr:DUF5654 family protein [archaeon]